MSESAVLLTLQRRVLEIWPNAHWQRIESHMTGGVPDVNLALPGLGEWWIEGKHLGDLPVRAETPVRIGLRADQRLWLNKRKAAGGRVIVFAKVAKLFMAFNDYFDELYEGLPYEKLVSRTYWSGRFVQPDLIFPAPQPILSSPPSPPEAQRCR